MENRPQSRSTTNGEDATLRTSTTLPPKRPVTKPVAPRLTSSTNTRPSVTSRTLSTTNSSALNKPPARPTTTATRRAQSTSTVASVHKPKPSTTSVEASEDESRRGGIAAKPKRISLASTTSATSTERLSTRSGATTPIRRTPVVPSTTRSVVRTTKPPIPHTSTSRTPASTRPTSLMDRKRLSTIPASPAVKGVVNDEDKENETNTQEKRAIRPVLGSRKSTRSVLLEQRLHEFELVNQMIQAAMVSDGMDGDEQETVSQEAQQAMTKLRSDLAKIRIFEKEHGHSPNEAELEDMDDVSEEVVEQVVQETVDTVSQEELNNVKTELERSQSEIAKLGLLLEEAVSKAEVYARSAEEDSSNALLATEALRAEHADVVEKLIAEHQTKLDELKGMHQVGADTSRADHRAQIEAIAGNNIRVLADKESELETLKAELKATKVEMQNSQTKDDELEQLGTELARMKEAASAESMAKDVELKELKLEIESMKESHSKSLEEKITELESLNAAATTSKLESESTKVELESLKAELNSRNYESTINSEKDTQITALQAELKALKQKPETSYDHSRDMSTGSESKELPETRQELEALQSRHAAAKKNAKFKIDKAAEGHRVEIASLRDQHAQEIVILQDQHTLEIEALHKSIQAVEKELSSKQDEIAKMADDHEQLQEELQSVQKSQHEEQTEKQATIKELQEQLENFKQVKEADIASSTKAVSILKKEHANQLQNVETQLRSAQEALRTANEIRDKQDSDNLAKLENDFKAVTDEITAAKENHKIAMESLQSELESAKNEIFMLEQVHAQKLNSIQTEAQSQQEAALEELRKTHDEQMQQLEKGSQSVMKDLEELEASHSSQLKQIKTEADAANRKVLDDQIEVHEARVKDIECQLTALRRGHEEQHSALTASHESEKASALADLTSKHEKKVSEMEQSLSTQNIAMEEMKDNHIKQVQQIESQSRSAASEADAARFQIQTLKSIMQDIEKESEQSRAEHEKELEKVQSDFSNAVARMSAQSAQIFNMQSQHDTQLTEFRNSAGSDRKVALEKQAEEHKGALKVLARDLTANHESAVQALTLELGKALEAIKSDTTFHEKEIEKLRSNHERVVAELKAPMQESNEALKKAKVAHERALDDLRDGLVGKHESAIEELQQQHDVKLAEASRTIAEADRARVEHDKIVVNLQSELEGFRVKSQDTTEVDTLRAQIDESRQSMKRMQEAQAEMMSSISKEHETMVNKLQAEVKNLRDEAQKPRDTSEVDGFKTQLAEAKAKHDTLAEQHRKDLEVKSQEHEQALSSLLSQLEQANSTSTEVEGVQGLLRDAKITINELNEQYAQAIVEAEAQRVSAEKADRELVELKKSLGARAKDSNGDRNITSPQPGLKASKWALDDEDNHVAEFQNGTHDTISTEQYSKKRNVRVQMAGIQEQIRQLDEMSADLLEENQRMARTLSRVDDDGTLMNAVEE